MKLKFKKAIETSYNIGIQKYTSAPHQFVAETFILNDTKNNQYFCKIINKPLFIPGIIATLPIVEQMHAQGIENICYPIRGKEGLYLFIEGTLIIILNYIHAPQRFDYNLELLGSEIAKIHAITPNIAIKTPVENFNFPNKELFNIRFESSLISHSSDNITKGFKKLLSKHEKEIRFYITKFILLGKQCKEEQDNLVITHGDLPTNVLAKTSDDIYIIDWDELRLAPAERDLWMLDHQAKFLKGYKKIIPTFSINQKMRNFCVLQYYFERMMHYFSEILNESADYNYRLQHLQKLSKNRMAGWILPKIEEIKNKYL